MAFVSMATKIARIVSGAGLVLMTTFWFLLFVRIADGFAVGGVNGARGNLHRMLLGSTFWSDVHTDPLLAISQGYENLVFCVLITWALRELYAHAGSRD